MKLKTSTLVWTFIWCLFMGVTVGSIGIGAIFPSVNLVAKPFVCPNGQMQVVTKDYHPDPTRSVTTVTTFCVDGTTGAKTQLGIFPMSLYAGVLFGLVFFALTMIGISSKFITLPRSYYAADQQSMDLDPALVGFRSKLNSGRLSQEQNALMEQSVKNYYDKKSAGSSATKNFNSASRISHESVEEQLKEIKGLLDSHLITKQDYEKKKAEILNKM
jgi:hypothetical protein